MTVKFAEVDPAGTVTVEGTATFALFEDKLTTVAVPCAELSVTVPVAELPP